MKTTYAKGLVALTVLFAGSGCNDVGTALIVVQNQAPTDTIKCSYDPQGLFVQGYTQFDAASQPGLSIVIKLENNLQPIAINFGTELHPDTFMAPHFITPLRMDVAWECDVNSFSQDIGPLFLPQFSTTLPFCINRATKGFVGRDVVLAAGGAIAPGSQGLAGITIIPAELGKGFSDLFRLAQLTKNCCDSTGVNSGCSDAELAAANQMPTSECGILQSTFDQIAGANKLSSRSSTDIQKFLPYGIFDGNVVKPPPSPTGMGFNDVPTYPMHVRGIVEGVTGDGSIVSSTEFNDVIHICSHCGGSTPCSAIGP